MVVVIIALIFLYLVNQVFYHILVFFPIFLINLLPDVGEVGGLILLIVVFSWLFGEGKA